jgi:hypothetical protein
LLREKSFDVNKTEFENLMRLSLSVSDLFPAILHQGIVICGLRVVISDIHISKLYFSLVPKYEFPQSCRKLVPI